MTNEELSDQFRKFFQLPSSPVAVRISEEELDGPRPESSSRFCNFVRTVAYEGKKLVITEDDLSNFTAAVILGFTEPKYVDISPRIKPAKTKSIELTPLEESEGEPDVIVTITNPARMMEIVQILHQTTKKRLESSMTCAGSAIAGEATALPYMEGSSNLTLLCGGARTIGGYQEEELAIGIPFSTFAELAGSLTEPSLTDALCGCLMDDIPDHVEETFADMGFESGTDHFFGEFEDKTLRFYVDKDEKGMLSIMTVHYPLKLASEGQARTAKKIAEGLLAGRGMAITRENWLDLVLKTTFDRGLEKEALDKEEFQKNLSQIFSDFVKISDKVKEEASN